MSQRHRLIFRINVQFSYRILPGGGIMLMNVGLPKMLLHLDILPDVSPQFHYPLFYWLLITYEAVIIKNVQIPYLVIFEAPTLSMISEERSDLTQSVRLSDASLTNGNTDLQLQGSEDTIGGNRTDVKCWWSFKKHEDKPCGFGELYSVFVKYETIWFTR